MSCQIMTVQVLTICNCILLVCKGKSPIKYISFKVYSSFSEVKCNSTYKIPDTSYVELMRSVNLKQKIETRVLIWNIRGSGRARFKNQVKDLMKIYNPNIVILMGTLVNTNRAQQVIHILDIPNYDIL